VCVFEQADDEAESRGAYEGVTRRTMEYASWSVTARKFGGRQKKKKIKEKRGPPMSRTQRQTSWWMRPSERRAMMNQAKKKPPQRGMKYLAILKKKMATAPPNTPAITLRRTKIPRIVADGGFTVVGGRPKCRQSTTPTSEAA
jgi:hypothetical protein